MTSKSLKHSFVIIFITFLTENSLAGIISVDEPKHHEHHEHEHHEHHELHEDHHDHHKATSYMHFHGPVEGPEYEVKIPYIEPHHHEHHHHEEHHHEEHHHEEHNHLHHHEPHYVMDYVAHPKYKYSYGVEDYHTGDFHSQKEERDGSGVTGEYTILEPGGRYRTVSYRADKHGFHATVHTSGKNDHSGYHQHHGESHHHHHIETASSETIEHHGGGGEEHQLLHEYPVSFSGHESGGGFQ